MRKATVSREIISVKLRFLASAVGYMDGHIDEVNEDTFFALSVMLSSLAREVYPEGCAGQDPPNESKDE